MTARTAHSWICRAYSLTVHSMRDNPGLTCLECDIGEHFL